MSYQYVDSLILKGMVKPVKRLHLFKHRNNFQTWYLYGLHDVASCTLGPGNFDSKPSRISLTYSTITYL